MNLDYLKDLLANAQSLTYHQPEKGDDLKVKVVDALKEIGLHDVTCVKIGFLNFTRIGIRGRTDLHPDFSNSRQFLISILESKIKVYESRIERARLQQQNLAVAAKKRESTIESSTLTSLKDCREINEKYEDLMKRNTSLVDTLNEHIELLTKEVDKFPNELKKKARIWNVYSGVFWGIVFTVVIGLLWGMYNLGKDNGGREYDTEKKILDNENMSLKSVIIEKNKEIDSLKFLIPKVSPVN